MLSTVLGRACKVIFLAFVILKRRAPHTEQTSQLPRNVEQIQQQQGCFCDKLSEEPFSQKEISHQGERLAGDCSRERGAGHPDCSVWKSEERAEHEAWIYKTVTDQEEVNFSTSITLSPTGDRSIQTAYSMPNLSVPLAEFTNDDHHFLRKKNSLAFMM